MNILDNEELINNTIPESLRTDIINNKDLINTNITFLKDLGVTNYEEVFKKYYPMFLMDASNFKAIFNKYDHNDLLEKINKNMAIIEHL